MSISIDDLKKNGFGQLPDGPGVYFFVAQNKDILYIGKATSLRDRVRSYFSQDIARARGPKIVRMLELAYSVKTQSTDSVLEALLLESQLIKKHQPPYNTDEKDDKSFLYAVITREKFPRVLLKRGRDLQMSSTDLNKEYKYVFGPFASGGSLKEALKIVRRIFPFRDMCVPFADTERYHQGENIRTKGKRKSDFEPSVELTAGEEQISRRSRQHSQKPCFNAQIGLCPGVCTGAMSATEYAKTIRHIKLFFEGKKSLLVRQLNKEMKTAIDTMAFERANELKKTLFALGHIKDVSLLNKDFLKGHVDDNNSTDRENVFRIEAYDAAHLTGQEVVGVMTVVENGRTNKNAYRKFHIRGGTGNDLASLEQMLRRRLRHAEWRLPDLIVVDGFDLQISVAHRVLSEFALDIPVVSVVKDVHHQPKDILGDLKMGEQYKESILLANAEAHRFAISFHRKTRSKRFLGR